MKSTTTYLTRSLSAETLKLKNTFALWMAILAPCALISMFFLAFWSKGEHLVMKSLGPWTSFGFRTFALYTQLLMPIFIALLTSMTNGIEHKANGWKHLYALPLPKSTVYFSKAALVLGLVACSTLVFMLAILSAGTVLRWLRPDLGFQNYEGISMILITSVKIFLASFVIVAIQFWLSMRWSSFALSMGVAIVAIITTVVASRWEHIHYYPFAYPLMTFNGYMKQSGQFFTEEIWRSLAVGTAVFILGYMDISRKKIL
ncbi:ABC transporter permease [Pontibacter sp. 172403-2]|uniref:ABC transporter permease n=1 Tax=Pontibacter rufus TaxID=2791028 RepID=UPI0018AFB652|nr:ABC transporter permease [Pontibacter sp. 172403-2]MBF9254680.1 ABC transporter permease [Pontibacter sp. 172403-2]